jgi:REP element-mobilizing transposase RayT
LSSYNSSKHRRKSIRLKGYDYSQKGLYFITICTQNREYLFGEINNEKMILNCAGFMIEKWYREIESKFPDIKCLQFVIMPNHIYIN